MSGSDDYAVPCDLEATLKEYKSLEKSDREPHDHFKHKTDEEFWNENLPIYKLYVDVSELTLPLARELRSVVEDWVMSNKARINTVRLDNTVNGGMY